MFVLLRMFILHGVTKQLHRILIEAETHSGIC